MKKNSWVAVWTTGAGIPIIGIIAGFIIIGPHSAVARRTALESFMFVYSVVKKNKNLFTRVTTDPYREWKDQILSGFYRIKKWWYRLKNADSADFFAENRYSMTGNNSNQIILMGSKWPTITLEISSDLTNWHRNVANIKKNTAQLH